ncbi:hypothetical protein C0J52_07188 [Blattella germanica]|nr:hypothetical protein C0J52_07188 [Blattella germanica]
MPSLKVHGRLDRESENDTFESRAVCRDVMESDKRESSITSATPSLKALLPPTPSSKALLPRSVQLLLNVTIVFCVLHEYCYNFDKKTIVYLFYSKRIIIMATAQMQRPKEALNTWSELLPNPTLSKNQSEMFVKKLVALAVSNVTYLRAMFPEDAYVQRQLEGIRLKILRDDGSCPSAGKLILWLKGAFEALSKNFNDAASILSSDRRVRTVRETKLNESTMSEDIIDSSQSDAKHIQQSRMVQPEEAMSVPPVSPAQPETGDKFQSCTEALKTPTEVREAGVRCACGIEKDGGLMACYGLMNQDDLPQVHVCEQCHKPESEIQKCTDIKLLGLTKQQRQEICLYRRALSCIEESRITPKFLSEELDVSDEIAKLLFELLDRDGVLRRSKG